jgi:hypothetical protein
MLLGWCPMTGAHRRRYQLGFGVAVEFVFRPTECRKDGLSATALVCEWDPAMPRFQPGNAKNKFLRRYTAARDDFLQDVAQLLGGSILNVDIDEQRRSAEMTAFAPQVPS